MKDNIIKGIIEEAYPSLNFKVRTEDGKEMLVHLAGKLRINRIRIVPGDSVLIETTPYDPRRGRIVRRL